MLVEKKREKSELNFNFEFVFHATLPSHHHDHVDWHPCSCMCILSATCNNNNKTNKKSHQFNVAITYRAEWMVVRTLNRKVFLQSRVHMNDQAQHQYTQLQSPVARNIIALYVVPPHHQRRIVSAIAVKKSEYLGRQSPGAEFNILPRKERMKLFQFRYLIPASKVA